MKTPTDTFATGEELYKELTNGIPGAIFKYILSPDNSDKIAYMSAGCFSIWELEPQCALDSPSFLWNQVVAKDVKGLQHSIEQSAKTMSFWSHEWQITTPSGQVKTLSGTGSPKKSDNGDIVWNSVVIDVSSERHLKKALDSFFGQQFSLNAIVSLEGKFLKVNNLWETTLGYKKEELEGRPFLDLVHPEDIAKTREEAQKRAASASGSMNFVNRYRHKDGSYRIFSWSSNPSPKENLIYASAVDITMSRQSEDKLRQAAAVFESTADGVMITNLGLHIIEVNKAFCDITGLSEDEALGQHLSILRSDKHDEAFYQAKWQQVNDTGHWQGEVWSKRKDGSVFPKLLTMSTIRKEGKLSGYVGVFSDISTIQEHKEKLVHLAHYDPLTGLPNRLMFKKHLSNSINLAAKSNTEFAIIFIDLDSFKYINDSMGHPVGDELLNKIAERLLATIRECDIVARISGDEFVILLKDINGAEEVSFWARQLLKVFCDAFYVNKIEISVTASMGISIYPKDAKDISTLMSNADAAMYKAKEEGKNTYTFYSPELTSQAVEFVFMENALKKALNQNQFFIQYQPQLASDAKTLIGLEALVRWQHPEKGLISPERFISIAEQNGTIRELGYWVLKTSCLQAANWLAEGIDIGRIAVNVSAVQFYEDDFLSEITSILESSALPAHHLELEITESLVMRHADKVIEKLKHLNQLNITVAVDDFGTGYSSLSYLKKLPVDRLKIDRSFIMDIPDDEDDKAITDAIIGLAKTLNLGVIAEGVETQSQAEFLWGKSCDLQGYLFSKPINADEIPQFVKQLNSR